MREGRKLKENLNWNRYDTELKWWCRVMLHSFQPSKAPLLKNMLNVSVRCAEKRAATSTLIWVTRTRTRAARSTSGAALWARGGTVAGASGTAASSGAAASSSCSPASDSPSDLATSGASPTRLTRVAAVKNLPSFAFYHRNQLGDRTRLGLRNN